MTTPVQTEVDVAQLRGFADAMETLGQPTAAYTLRQCADEIERLRRERDEALAVAEGPSTLRDLAAGFVERGFNEHAAEQRAKAFNSGAAISIIRKMAAALDDFPSLDRANELVAEARAAGFLVDKP